MYFSHLASAFSFATDTVMAWGTCGCMTVSVCTLEAGLWSTHLLPAERDLLCRTGIGVFWSGWKRNWETSTTQDYLEEPLEVQQLTYKFTTTEIRPVQARHVSHLMFSYQTEPTGIFRQQCIQSIVIWELPFQQTAKDRIVVTPDTVHGKFRKNNPFCILDQKPIIMPALWTNT